MLSATTRLPNFLNNLHFRNHHVMASSSVYITCSEKTGTKTHNLSANKAILQQISAPGLGTRRNFSLTPGILASAVENVEKTASLQIHDVPATSVEEIVVQALAANGEPTFASLGLGGYSPIGLLQNALEFMHVSLDLPWYATIALSTVIIRILVTPLIVISQRNAIMMGNVMPEMQEIQNKMTKARQMGNAIEYAQCNQELMKMMREKGLNPIKNMLTTFAQLPIFVSYYLGITRMVDAPIESLHTGGALWFTDLTIADPYYILPLITCGTLILTVHLGTDTARVPGQKNPMFIHIFKALPIVMFPFIMNFPAALVVYWASSNLFSLLQGQLFKIRRVRTFFNIPQIIAHELPRKAEKKEVVVENIIRAQSNLKMSREIEDSKRLNRINFERAGTRIRGLDK